MRRPIWWSLLGIPLPEKVLGPSMVVSEAFSGQLGLQAHSDSNETLPTVRRQSALRTVDYPTLVVPSHYGVMRRLHKTEATRPM